MPSNISNSPALSQRSRLIEWVIVIGTEIYCQSPAKIQTLVRYRLVELCNSIAPPLELSIKTPTLFSLNSEPYSRTVLSSGSDMDPCAMRTLKLDIGIELLSRTGASQLDTDPCAIRTGRLVGQYSGSSRVSHFYRLLWVSQRNWRQYSQNHYILSLTPSSESVKLKPQLT